MAVVPPPLPPFIPDVGSKWFCNAPLGWPNSVTPQCIWGSIITVTDYLLLSGKWYVRFNCTWNSFHTVVGSRILPSDFYKVFTQQPILICKAVYHGSGECGITNPNKRISGTGRGWVGRFTEVQPITELL